MLAAIGPPAVPVAGQIDDVVDLREGFHGGAERGGLVRAGATELAVEEGVQQQGEDTVRGVDRDLPIGPNAGADAS